MIRAIFPAEAYGDGAQFQRERQTLFAQNWLPFAASGQMPAAGDFVGQGIGGWPLLAVRGGEGIARGFHNVCRHQSMPVVDQGPGHCEALRCRYHGWTYGFDGRLVEAPPRYPPAGSIAEIALEPAELVERDGVCLVRVKPGPEPPPNLGFPDKRFATALTTDVNANWKAVLEALLDGGMGRFAFPLALIGQDVIRQIVPRAFSRTRIIDLIFSGDGRPDPTALATRRETAAADKSAAEACHARRAAGEPSPGSGPAADFLAALAAACA
ncbi:MAG TPA: Rieske 2Fe-2S domain-containing protein [Stellaceae bacterium]|jgi:phenylpropionate dioxygenase-like ring-hydroxylating dioxygenase large terminal subunit|nr:Rieske 2Fe-2S domain-containing protein [Stellaceae bacterium]